MFLAFLPGRMFQVADHPQSAGVPSCMQSRAINVPSQLLLHLEHQKRDTGVEALLIHISTDQVRCNAVT